MFTEEETNKILAVKEIVKMELESLLYSIEIYSDGGKDIYVSGGCFASLLQGGTPNDYDVYFRTEKSMNSVKNVFVNILKDDIEDVSENYREFLGKDGKLITENAITLKNKFQLILKHYGEPEILRKTFDFVHCMPYYDNQEDKLYISRFQYDAIVNKKLIMNDGNTFPPHRMDKFKKRGYTWA